MSEGFLQVLGLLRWSYPSALDAFQIEAPTMEALRATLYAPERLEERLFFLEHLVLPCLAAQGDKNFRVVMLMGDSLPEPWRGRVLEAVAHVPQVVPVFEAEGQKHREVCRKVMLAHRNKKASAVAEFRLDDDDAVHRDFVAATRRTFRRQRRLLEEQGRFAVDHTRGLALVMEGDVTAHPILAHLWVAALALIYPPGHRKSLLDYPHKRLWISMPTITLPGPVGWIRGVHGSNDSTIAGGVGSQPAWEADEAEIETICEERFGIDLPALRAGWAELRGRGA